MIPNYGLNSIMSGVFFLLVTTNFGQTLTRTTPLINSTRLVILVECQTVKRGKWHVQCSVRLTVDSVNRRLSVRARSSTFHTESTVPPCSRLLKVPGLPNLDAPPVDLCQEINTLSAGQPPLAHQCQRSLMAFPRL